MALSFASRPNRKAVLASSTVILSALALPAFAQTAEPAEPAPEKPNILIIFPDDVGWSNISAYGNGVMG